MPRIAYIRKEDLGQYENLEELKVLDSIEDVATLIEVFSETRKSVNYRKIQGVVRDDENYYYMVVGDESPEFDLFSFINSAFDEEIRVNCNNAKLVFPKRFSRGVYEYLEEVPEEDYDDEDDIPTSFLDEDEILTGMEKVFRLNYRGHGITIDVPREGLTIGRSKRSDFLVKDNNNVGRVHCNVYVDDKDRLMVHDFRSLNGTFVNSKRVSEERDEQLRVGDILYVAGEEFEVL